MKTLFLLVAAGASWAAAQNGKSLYAAQCAACHQTSGKGVPGAFPPQAGHFQDLLAAGGRDYAVNVVLYGLAGKLQIGGKTYDGVMPSFAQLSDTEIAAVLNYVATSWGNDFPDKQSPFKAADVKAGRTDKKKPEDVAVLRPKTLK